MRANRHQMFMAMARAASTRSTCYRLSVGAVVVRDHNVVSVGYNGAPPGQPHCTGNGCVYFSDTGCRVVHAEENALRRLDAATTGIFELYVTHSLCWRCVDLLVRQFSFVRSVYFETPYRDPVPVKTLVGEGVRVRQVLPSGLVVDMSTGQLSEGD